MYRSTKSFIAVGVIFIVAICTFLFFSIAVEPYSSAKVQSNKIAYKAANITSPDYFANFSQDKQYFTVGGLNNKNQYKYVVINAKSGKIKVLEGNKYDRSYLLTQLKSKFSPKKVLHMDLGLINKRPTWEISFIDKEKNISYVMFDYKTGKINQVIDKI